MKWQLKAGEYLKTENMSKLLPQLALQSMVIPGLILLVVFSYIPLAGILIAFKNYDLYKGFFDSPWVGFKNFRDFFMNDSFWIIMKNTLCISFLKLAFCFPAPIVLALLFNELKNQKAKRIFQTITYLPHFVSWVIVSGMVISLLSVDGGAINTVLSKLNVLDEPVNFLSTPEYFWTILVSSNVWKVIGFNSIIFLAAISGINADLYEAASIDGASRFKQVFIVTLPCIIPQIVILLILNVSNILNAGFDDILLLTNNGENAILNSVAEVIDTYVYRVGIKTQRYSFATSIGLFKSIVSITMLFSANMFLRKTTESSLW